MMYCVFVLLHTLSHASDLAASGVLVRPSACDRYPSSTHRICGSTIGLFLFVCKRCLRFVLFCRFISRIVDMEGASVIVSSTKREFYQATGDMYSMQVNHVCRPCRSLLTWVWPFRPPWHYPYRPGRRRSRSVTSPGSTSPSPRMTPSPLSLPRARVHLHAPIVCIEQGDLFYSVGPHRILC